MHAQLAFFAEKTKEIPNLDTLLDPAIVREMRDQIDNILNDPSRFDRTIGFSAKDVKMFLDIAYNMLVQIETLEERVDKLRYGLENSRDGYVE